MRKRLATGYTFDASAKTVVHADFSDIGLDGIQLITNVTDGIVIYQFNKPSKNGSLSTDTLTLDFDTTAMDDSDKLMILVEDGLNQQDTNLKQVNGTTVDTNSGSKSAGSQRVVLATDDINTAAIKAAVEIMDDWDESDRAKVNLIAGQTGVQGASGTVSANTQRVVLATDVALPAGTNGIGKLTANSGVDIGDVDVTSVTPGTTASSLGKAEDAAHTSGDVGVMMLGVRNDNLATTYGADQDYIPGAHDLGGRYMVAQKAATATLSNVSSSATTVTILAANSSRVGGSIYNDSTQILYLKYGTTASTSSFTAKLAADTYFEINAGYTGRIDGIWASANGNARVTEIT